MRWPYELPCRALIFFSKVLMDVATLSFDACTQVSKEDFIAASAFLMARANQGCLYRCNHELYEHVKLGGGR